MMQIWEGSPVSRDIVSPIRLSPIRLSGEMNKSIPRMESTGIEYPPLKLKLDIRRKMLMLNICSVNVWIQDAPADLRHNISLIYIRFFSGPQFEKSWLRKLRTIALPVYFMVLNFDYDIQLSLIHVSKYCLMPVTFYPAVVILRGGGKMGIEVEYPIGYANFFGGD